MFAILPPYVTSPGYSGTPSLVSSPGWGAQEAPTLHRRVTIYRDSLDTPWGFRLQGGKDFNTPLSVKRVFSGSPADGQLTRDDLILAINDHPVEDVTLAEVLEKIKSAGSSVVLTILTSTSGSQFDSTIPLDNTNRQEQFYTQTPQQETKATSATEYDSFQEPSAISHEISPLNYGLRSQKAANRNIQRTAKRFQPTAHLSTGLSEPGWVARPKSLPKVPLSAAPEPALLPQPRSTCQTANQPTNSVLWKSENAPADKSQVPAWYGSLRSNRAAHPWEVRAAKLQTQTGEETQQNVWSEPEDTHSQPSRTFKAEIRGLILSHPSYHQTQSTANLEDTYEEHLYHPKGQVHSAPETPVTGKTSRTIHLEAIKLPSSQENVTSSATAYSKQAESSVSVQIQPSVLYGAGSARTVHPPPQTKTIVTIRAEPHETKGTVTKVQAKEDVKSLVTTPKPDPVPKPVAASQARSAEIAAQPSKDQAEPHTRVQDQTRKPPHLPDVVQQFNTTPDKPAMHPQVPLVHLKSVPHKLEEIPQNPVKHFNSVPERPAKVTQTPLERFNPVPDRPAKVPQIPLERFNPVPDRPAKVPQKSFNPVPKRPAQVPQTPVESFNQVPNRPAKVPQTPVERFNPVPDRPAKVSQKTFNPMPERPAKVPQTPVESFNQVPNRPAKVLQTPLERFNPVPERPAKVPQTPVERFNPVPDRPLTV